MLIVLLLSSRGLFGQLSDVRFSGKIQSLTLETGKIEVLLKTSAPNLQNIEASLLDPRGEAQAKIAIISIRDSILRAKILSYYQTDIVSGSDVIVLVKKTDLESSIKTLIASAEQEQAAGRPAQALDIYERALTLDPAESQTIDRIQDISLLLTTPLILKGDFEAALTIIDRGLKHCRDSSQACARSQDKKTEILGLRAAFSEKLKRIDTLLAGQNAAEALDMLDSLLLIHPENQRLQQLRGQTASLTQARSSKKTEALGILKTTEKMIAKEEYRGALKYLELHEQGYPEFVTEFDKIKLDIYVKTGNLFYLSKNYRDSLFWLDKGLSLFPNDARLRSAYQQSKNSLIADLMNRGENQYRLKNYSQAQGLFKEVRSLDPSHAKGSEMINECQYQLYLKDADNNFAAGNMEGALTIYRRAFGLYTRDHPRGRISTILRRRMQRGLADDDFASYEKSLVELLAVKNISSGDLQSSKAELKAKIVRLSGEGNPYSEKWLEIAVQYFPGEASFFATPSNAPKEEVPLPAPKPSEKKPVQTAPPQEPRRPIPEYPSASKREKTSLSRREGKKSFFYAGLTLLRPPDPAPYYTDMAAIARIGDSGSSALGGGVGIVIGLSPSLFLDLSVNYSTHKLPYEYEVLDPSYGIILVDGEITNSLMNYALTLNLRLAPLYFGGGGNYTVMSPSKSNIPVLPPSTNSAGFGYHYGAGLMLIKNMIWVDYKRFRAWLSTPVGAKTMDFNSVNIKLCLAF